MAAAVRYSSGVGAQAQAPPATSSSASSRERLLLLDFGWRFHFGHVFDPARDFGFASATAPAKSGGLRPSEVKFDDSAWRPVDLPHDWAVELAFENDPELLNNGFKPLGRSYPATSIGWYRRVFEIPAADLGKRISIEFDGVFRDCETALNGYNLGRNQSGYAPFRYDITDIVNYGGKNALAVRVDATQHEGWWYEGAGIYRHTWLVKTSPVHVAHGGTFVTSEIKPDRAVVTVFTEIENESGSEQSCRVSSAILDPEGRSAADGTSPALTIPVRGHVEFRQQFPIANPELWSLDQPRMNRLVTTVFAGAAEVDRYETPFGIRAIRFDPDSGFYLNGKPVKIKGTCNHQDHAGVGVALPDRVHAYRIETLKEMGSNAYRTSHNPAAPELLDAADRIGMLVMAETRTMSSSPEGLSQLERMIRRDRNHPSIILWSLGNEEAEQGEPRGARIVRTMRQLVRRLDPTRPVTVAMNNHWGKGISESVDVQGFNYKSGGPEMDSFHQQFPKQPAIGTEVASTLSTRGIYANDKERGYFSAYDANAPEWGALAEPWWKAYAERPYLAGGFVWTGFDYRGEPTTYKWPCIHSAFGILDTCGFPKDNYYYYRAWWSGKPVLHLFPHWNWREGQEIEVWCHTNLERVELFLNGRSLGAKDVPRYSHAAWKVPYAPGVLEARGFAKGQQVLAAKRETAGDAAAVELRPDRAKISADGEDVSMVEVRIVDSVGRVAPLADNEIVFHVSGSGKLIGVGNGNPSSHESDKGPVRRAFNGLCLAIVQSTKTAGEIRVKAESPGLKPVELVIEAAPAQLRPAVA